MAGLTYFRWYFDKAKIYEDLLTDEQLGRLFRATMVYARDGTETEVASDILFPYRECKLAVDHSRGAYEKKSAVNKKNGAKGGRTKAANSNKANTQKDGQPQKEAGNPKGFTKSEYKAAVAHLRRNGECDVDTHDSLKFYDELTGADWMICGRPVKDTKTLESVLRGRFPAVLYMANQFQDWAIFRIFFAKGLHGEVEAFWDECSDSKKGWTIEGEFYSKAKVADAAKAYIRRYEQPT